MSRPTIEDVLADELHPWECPALQVSRDQADRLYALTADGPLRSDDGTLVVHRADPELAGEIRSALNRRVACGRNSDRFVTGGEARDLLRRAARLVAGDPEEAA